MLVDHRIVAKRAPEPGAYHSEPAGAGDSDPEGPRITVILTTIEWPLAALRAAINLARGLRAEIVLVAEVVLLPLPVGAPSHGIELFRKTRHRTRR